MTNRKYIEDYFEACSNGDPTELRGFLAEDVAVYDTLAKPVIGRDNLLEDNKNLREMWSGARWYVDNYVGNGDIAAVEWTMTGSKDGVAHTLRGMDYYQFRDGLIKEVHQYWSFNRKSPESGLRGYDYTADSTYH